MQHLASNNAESTHQSNTNKGGEDSGVVEAATEKHQELSKQSDSEIDSYDKLQVQFHEIMRDDSSPEKEEKESGKAGFGAKLKTGDGGAPGPVTGEADFLVLDSLQQHLREKEVGGSDQVDEEEANPWRKQHGRLGDGLDIGMHSELIGPQDSSEVGLFDSNIARPVVVEGEHDLMAVVDPEAKSPGSQLNPQHLSDQVIEIEEVLAAEEDERFYSLQELIALEPQLEQQCQAFGGNNTNASNAHYLLTPQQYRAKLYFLNPENKWIDIGTGYFRILLSKDQEEHYMQILSEEFVSTTGVDASSSDTSNNEELAQIASAKFAEDLDAEGHKAMKGGVGSTGGPLDMIEDIEDKPDLVGQFQPSSGPPPAGHDEIGGNVPQILHRSFIGKQQEYSRQRDTIITWQNEGKNDFALSFQDQRGALNTWFSICYLKGIQVSAHLDDQQTAGENGNQQDSEDLQEDIPMPNLENLDTIVESLVDSDPYMRRRIAQAVIKGGTFEAGGHNNSYYKEHRTTITNTPYLDRLHSLFCEIEENYKNAIRKPAFDGPEQQEKYLQTQRCVSNLHSMFHIYRNLLSFNERELLEVLLNEFYWRTTFGALEYDPDVFMPTNKSFSNKDELQASGEHSPGYQYGSGSSPRGVNQTDSASAQDSEVNAASMAANFTGSNLGSSTAKPAEGAQHNSYLPEAGFRDFLDHKVKYREEVTISDPAIVRCIHLSYRLQYLKDTAMARFIDDTTSHTIMQLNVSNQQQILEYIFGEDFERIQNELLAKMQSTSNVQQKENALKFFMEICQLLKSIQLNHRFPFQCNREFNKIMTVLAQIYNIMIPDKRTLKAEVAGNKDKVISIYVNREKDIREAKGEGKSAKREEESGDKAEEPPQASERESRPPRASKDQSPFSQVIQEEITPPREILIEYLKNPNPNEDPKMTQIDMLKSNSIEIFYNLLMVQSNVNIRQFLCSESQRQQNFIFLRHLATHMIYSTQTGIKVSICEFLKDLISQDSIERKMEFEEIILEEVVSIFLTFLSDNPHTPSVQQPQTHSQEGTDRQSEEKKSQGSTTDIKLDLLYQKQLEQSRCLIIQFLNKLVQDTVSPHQIRVFFVKNKVFQKVANLGRYQSRQVNVEIIKFFKAIIQSKDKTGISYMIRNDLFDKLIRIFLENPNKKNLLHSCILSLFDMLPNVLQPDLFHKLMKRLVERGHATNVFLSKEFEKDFRKFNYHVQQAVDAASEQESKQRSDRDQSSPQRDRSYSDYRKAENKISSAAEKQAQMEDQLMKACFSSDSNGAKSSPEPANATGGNKTGDLQRTASAASGDWPEIEDELELQGEDANSDNSSDSDREVIDADKEPSEKNDKVMGEANIEAIVAEEVKRQEKRERDRQDEEYNQQAYLKHKQLQEQRKRMPSPQVTRSDANSPFKTMATQPGQTAGVFSSLTKAKYQKNEGAAGTTFGANYEGRGARSMSPVRNTSISAKIAIELVGSFVPQGVDEMEQIEQIERRLSGGASKDLKKSSPTGKKGSKTIAPVPGQNTNLSGVANSSHSSSEKGGNNEAVPTDENVNPDNDEHQFNTNLWLRGANSGSSSENGIKRARSCSSEKQPHLVPLLKTFDEPMQQNSQLGAPSSSMLQKKARDQVSSDLIVLDDAPVDEVHLIGVKRTIDPTSGQIHTKDDDRLKEVSADEIHPNTSMKRKKTTEC